VCYYSDWNTYDTMGLNTRQIADGSIKPIQVYARENTELVFQNCDEADPISRRCRAELQASLGRLGYEFAGTVPILTERAGRRAVVAVFTRSPSRARSLLQGLQVASQIPASQSPWTSALRWGRPSWWRDVSPSYRSAPGGVPSLP
jgi:hypothetical protein